MLEANSEANNPPLATNTLPTITLNVHHSNLMLSYINHSNLMLSFVIWSKKKLESMDNKQQRKGDKINEVQNNDWTGHDFKGNSNGSNIVHSLHLQLTPCTAEFVTSIRIQV
jgi:hypothetical protein